jgi:CDP-diglyceride synthetase
MSSDETEVRGPVETEADGEPAGQPSWWHRDHPTFSALSGFFTGLLFVLLVPALFVGILSLLFDNNRVEELFPLVLVTLIVPLGLVLSSRSRRFGTYMWIGLVTTAIVVVGVGALVLYVLVNGQS